MARFVKDEPVGVSDNLHTDTKRAHMVQNWAVNPTYEGVPPFVNAVGGGDNTGYRVMPGRKRGIFSGG